MINITAAPSIHRNPFPLLEFLNLWQRQEQMTLCNHVLRRATTSVVVQCPSSSPSTSSTGGTSVLRHLRRAMVIGSGTAPTKSRVSMFSSNSRSRRTRRTSYLDDHTGMSRDRHEQGNAVGFQIVGTVAIVAGAASAVAMAYCDDGGETYDAATLSHPSPKYRMLDAPSSTDAHDQHPREDQRESLRLISNEAKDTFSLVDTSR